MLKFTYLSLHELLKLFEGGVRLKKVLFFQQVKYRNGRDSNLFFVGSQWQTNVAIRETGRLYIGINNDYLRDNIRSYRVKVRW